MTNYVIKDKITRETIATLWEIDEVKKLDLNRVGLKSANVFGYVAIVWLDNCELQEM